MLPYIYRIAGGKGYSSCADTFKDDDNCAFNDRCKKVITMYYLFDDDPLCDSYSFCKGVAVKPDCKLLRVGV